MSPDLSDRLAELDRRLLILVAVLAVVAVGGFVLADSGDRVPASNTVPLESTDGPRVFVEVSTEIDVADPYPDDETVRVETNSGVVQLSSVGRTEVTVSESDLEGRYTDLRQISLNGNTLQINPADKGRVSLSGSPDRFAFDTLNPDDGNADLRWQAAQGTNATVTLRGLSSEQAIGVLDPSSNTIVARGVTTSFGSITLDLPGDGTLRDGRLTTPSGAPTISQESPSDGTKLSQEQNSVAFNASHPDIGQTDLEVTTVFDGQQVDQRTISSNSDLSIPVTAERGGVYQWSVTVEDDWGQTTTESYSFRIPDNVTIFDALNTSRQLVTGEQVHGKTIPRFQVEFFGANGGTEQQTVTNGTIDLAGLHVVDPISLRIREDNSSTLEYETRNVYIESIYSQTEIYMVPGNETQTQEVVFELDDKSGQFDRDSVLQVQRQLTKDFDGDGTNESRFQTMAGDSFDVSNKRGFVLLDDERYRLVLSNQDGDRRVLGEYDVDASVVETLEVGEISYGDSVETGNKLNAEVTTINGDRMIKFQYADGDEVTDSISIEIRNLDTGQTIHEVDNIFGPFGTYSEAVPVPNGTSDDATFRVVVLADRDGEQEELTDTVGNVKDIGGRTGVPSRLLFLFSWGAIIAMGGLVAIYDDAIASLVMWIMATALTVFGFLSVPALWLTFAGGIALLFNIARRAPVR